MQHVIMPLAGLGKRFSGAGFHGSKPLIDIGGVPMLVWAARCLPPTAQILAPCRRTDRYYRELAACIEKYHLPITLLPLPGATQGAACTVLAAVLGLPPGDSVLIMNADQYFTADLLALERRARDATWDGYILTFHATDNRWSYVAVDEHLWVQRVVEKEPISTHATVGAYWFRHAGNCAWACARAIAEDDRTRGEFYVAPIYNYCIRAGQRIKAVPVQSMYGLGTPEDVATFANMTGIG